MCVMDAGSSLDRVVRGHSNYVKELSLSRVLDMTSKLVPGRRRVP